MSMAETNSESNVLLSSEETDDESMNDAEAVAMISSEAINSTGLPSLSAITFPAEAFLQLMDGLNKLPTWTVYPRQLGDCIKATARITRNKQRYTAQEGTMMRRLVREGLAQAFSKCLDDGAVLSWHQSTQQEIFAACNELANLAAAKLEEFIECCDGASTDPEDRPDMEEDLGCIFNELTMAFDPNSPFHIKNLGEELPLRFPRLDQDFAEPTAETDSITVPRGRGSESPQAVRLRQHEWLAHLINYYGSVGGFELLCKVLEHPGRLTISCLDLLLAPLVKAEELLLPSALQDLAERLQLLLAYMKKRVEDNVEHFSDKGRDRMFTAASSLLEKINVLLVKPFGPAEADAAVGKVQRQFIIKLLASSSFSKHLSAVRETNNLLMRALDLRTTDNGNSIKVNVEWMREHDVVKHLLRANLHQKQYVDQVQKVLKNLTIEGGLQEDHLDLLWNLTEKVDTFETVKNNVYDMLGDLAQDFSNDQLDSLFSKFEACTGRPVPDSMKIMDLMRRLAKSDTKGVMAKRVMNLLWSMMMNPEAPSEVSKSPAITDALQAYAGRKGMVDKEITLEYMRQCVTQIQAGTSVLPAMNLLQRLAANGQLHESEWHQGNEVLWHLNKEMDIINVVITSLEAYLATQRDTLIAAGAIPPIQLDSPEHGDILREYANFLLNVPTYGHFPYSWEHIERLWNAWIDNPLYLGDRHLGLQWFQLASNQRGLIFDSLSRLLTEKLTAVDVSMLFGSEPLFFWQLFCYSFRMVGFSTEKLQMPVPLEDPSQTVPVVKSLDLIGLPTMWRIVLDTDERSGIVESAQITLVSLHTNIDEELQKQAVVVRKQFIETCLGELLPAAQLLTGKAAEQGTWRDHSGPAPLLAAREHLMASRRAARCLALLQDLVAACQGRTMPAVPMHAASFQGSPARFEVQTTTSKQQPNRFRISCHSHMYVGQMRRSVAAKLAVQAENVRLFAHGRELVNDAKLVKDENIHDGTTLMAASTPNANNYTLLTAERAAEMEMASPASLLAKSPELYDVLLCLSDLCQDQLVRRNAMRLLEVMPTASQIVQQLGSVLSTPNPCDSMHQLLLGTGTATKPARLLYTLQALNALLFPVASVEDTATSPANPQLAFVNSGCISALLEAVKAGNHTSATDVHTIRSLHSTAQLLLTRLQGIIAKSTTSDVSMADAASLDQPMSVQETAPQSSDISINSGPRAALSPTAAVTVTLEGDATAALLTKPVTVDKSVLTEMLLFYLNLAIRAGRAWGTQSFDKLGQDVILPDQDAQINQDALTALKQLLEMQPQLHEVLFNSAEHKQALANMMLEGLLNCGHEAVRNNAFKLGERLSTSGSGQGHLHLLEMLHKLDFADCYPHFCMDYYRLLTEILRSIPRNPPEIKALELPIAEAMLADLVAVSATMTAVDEDDSRLEGKLRLLLELVTVLDRRHIGTPSGGGLVHRIITDFLFPESWFLHKLAESKQSLLSIPLSQIAQALRARCSTKSSRLAALELLHDLMSHNSTNLRDGMELICQIHLSTDIIRDDYMDYSPKVQARKPMSFVGLKNGGATCYMNSVFQQIFMQPSIRRLILSSKEVGKDERPNSVFYQLQAIFANLAMSKKDYYRPVNFWKAFKDYDGEQLNIKEHQDAYEFFTRLQDLVDQHMRDNKERPVMQLVMGGKFAQQIICRNVDFRSEKEEDFYQVSLDVRGKRNLEESLDFYVQGELMEGDNQYLCEELGKKVDAVKRNCIKVLPHMLVIHLKRFEYDYETMNRWKIKDRFEFPQELDMYKYTVTGLEERETSEAAMANEGSELPASSAPANPEQYQYYLKGIVVHSGTAFAGHYYSYIRVRSEAGQQSANAGKWFCYDDNSVEPWDAANLDRDCFGGKYTVDLQDPHLPTGPKEYDRPNSAYMLFYERADKLEPVAMIDEITAAAPREAASLVSGMPVADASAPSTTIPQTAEEAMLFSQERGRGMVSEAEASSSGRDLATVPIPNILSNIPSIYEEILSSNLKLMQELRLLDRDYFKFLFQLVKDNSEEPFLPPSSMRRTEPSPTLSGGNSAGSHPSSPEQSANTPSLTRREADTDQAAERVMNFAGQFVLRVFLKSASLLREDQEAWLQLLTSLMESNAAANRWFLYLCFVDYKALSAQTADNVLRLDDGMLENYLIWCEVDDVAKGFTQLLLQALKNAIERDNGTVSRKSLNPLSLEPRTGAWAVHHIVHILLNIMKSNEVLAAKHSSAFQFCTVLKEYANIGHHQREHMNALGFLKYVLLILDTADDRIRNQEIFILLEVASLLARSSDFNAAQGLKASPHNPYALPDPVLSKGSRDTYHALCSQQAPIEYLMFPSYLANEPLRNLLMFLLWKNKDLSMEWLQRVPNIVRKFTADQLHQIAPALVNLIAIDDNWRVPRVRMALLEPAPPSKDAGLLWQASESQASPTVGQTKRFAVIKLIVMLLQTVPEVFVALQGHDAWLAISDWLDKMQSMGAPVSMHQDFEVVDSVLQQFITQGQGPIQEVLEEDDDEVEPEDAAAE